MWVEMIAVGWIVLELTNSPFLVSLIGFFRMIPLLITGPFSGVIIDRTGRRRVILCAQLTYFSVAFTMFIIVLAGAAAYWHFALAAFVMGTAWSVDFPARRSLIPDLVGKAKTVDALLGESFSMNTARIIGPFAGGFVVYSAGALGCYLVICAVSLTSLVFLRRLPRGTIPRDAMPSAASTWEQLREGFRYVRGHRVIFAVILITLTMNFLGFPYMTLLPVFARDVLHQDATGLGLIGMASGLGSLLGILLITRWRRRYSSGAIYSMGSLFFAVMVAFFATSSSFWMSFAFLFLAGIGHACFSIMQSTLVLTSASDEMRSRAMGLIVVAIGMSPLGLLQMGALASRFGAPFAVQVSATCGALGVLLIMALLPRLWRTPSLAKSKKQEL